MWRHCRLLQPAHAQALTTQVPPLPMAVVHPISTSSRRRTTPTQWTRWCRRARLSPIYLNNTADEWMVYDRNSTRPNTYRESTVYVFLSLFFIFLLLPFASKLAVAWFRWIFAHMSSKSSASHISTTSPPFCIVLGLVMHYSFSSRAPHNSLIF
jgi:hypothetical protein